MEGQASQLNGQLLQLLLGRVWPAGDLAQGRRQR
jgi:hypothetical protein